MSSDKNFFWHGILHLNELGAHAFFDVKIKKNVPDAPNMVGIMTSDIPPLPMMNETDSLHVTFLLENNVGLNTVRYRVAESVFQGKDLFAMAEDAAHQTSITVTVESGEWQFSKQGTTWILRSILLYVPMAQLRKFIKDP